MTNQDIRRRLAITVLVLACLPLLASYFLVSEILDSAISLNSSENISRIFKDYQHDLKRLKTLDPNRSEVYKAKFYELEEMLTIHKDPQMLVGMIKSSFLTYYIILFVGIVILASFVAIILSRKVAAAYKNLFISDMSKSKRLQELQYFDEWQHIARKLAHEVKNPLTPIEMSIGNLARNYTHVKPEQYREQLHETYLVVSEEVKKLKEMINHFTRFSKLPEPELMPTDMAEYLNQYLNEHQNMRPRLRVELQLMPNFPVWVALDQRLLSQCLTNLLNNAEEANPEDHQIPISLILEKPEKSYISLIVKNRGRQISEEQRAKLFNMYYTTKTKRENMGLGLPIVKKMLLDHKGSIENLPDSNGALFKITLPLLNESTDK